MNSIFKRILSLSLAVLTAALLILSPIMPQAKALSYSGSSSFKSGKYYTNLTKVTLTGDQRTDIVNVAKSQIGYQEGGSSSALSGTVKGSGNYTEYGRWYGLQDMWCAMFVSWCAHVAGIPTSVVTSHSYTPTGLNWFKNKGQAYSRATIAAGGYTPQPGDIIYFKSSRNENITNHVGIVTSYSNGTVYTIEGNTSSATISTNGGAVCAKSYSISNTYIVYVCSPSYTTLTTADKLKSVVFDADYYSAAYSDLAASYGTDADKLYEHFLEFGIAEGRQASPMFDVKYYLENNSSVQEAVGSTTDYMAAYEYFLKTGYNKKAKTAEPANLGDNFYAKISYRSGKNLSLSDTNVIIYPDSDKPAQVWQFIRQKNGSYKIVNTKNSLSLTAADSAKTPGTNVELGVGSGANGQSWFLYKSGSKYVLRPYCSSYCVLDVAGGGTADLTNVQINLSDNTNAQLFTINQVEYTGNEVAVDLGKDVYVKISNVASGNYLATSNNNIVSAADKAAATRVFRLMHKSDGTYRIVGQNSNKTVTVEGAVDADGTNVHAKSNEDSTAQRWYIYRSGDHYTLRPALSETCRLEVAGGSTTSGANVQIGTASGGSEQLFNITVVDYLKAVNPTDLGDDFTAKLTNVASAKNMTLNGTNVISNAPSTAAAQSWRFVKQADGSYQIINQKNGCLLDLETANGGDGTNVVIRDPDAAVAPNWFIYILGSKYALRPSGSADCLLTVDGGSTADGTNIQINTFVGTSEQRFAFEITESSATSSGDLGITDAQMAVLRNIIYAVETGGQVYGKQDYTNFTEAYTNSTEEHAITIGAGQWYGTEAKTLLNLIRTTDPTTFAALDTAGIADALDTEDWSTYQLAESSAKAKCIVSIISSDVGIQCQDQLLDQQMTAYMKEAKALGVVNIDALMECANIRHQGGLGALQRVLGKTATPYTLDNIYAALQTDTGNQVGAYTNRQKFVYTNLKKYISNEVSSNVKYLPACDSSEVSIVTALANVGVENVTPEYRMKLAIANGITDYAYTADQNIQLLDLLKAGLLIDPEGTILTGWYTFTGGKRYYYDSTGNQVTGWLTQNGKTYYLDPDTGVMATGTLEIDGVTYDFGTDGVLVIDETCVHETHDAEGICAKCRQDIGHTYASVITGATCTEQGYTTFTCTCGHTYVEDYTAATGHCFVDGYCEVCEEPDPTPTIVPTLTLVSPSLSFESQIQYNIYYTAQDIDDVVEMGLITFNEKLTDGTIAEAVDVIPGYSTSGSEYVSHTNGIAAKNLSDALYFKVYAKLSNGTYAYSDMAGYHAVAYAQDILANSSNAKMRSLVVAMLNYGAAAQIHFNYKADSLMNSFLTDEHKALVTDYSTDMITGLVSADSAKTGNFARVSGSYSSIYPTVSFEGAFGINFYFTPAHEMDGELTFYYWTLDDYNAASVLTTENASGSFAAEGTGEYRAEIAGIAAKQLDETLFVSAVYESGGVSYPAGVFSYSLGYYCADRIANGSGTMVTLAEATAVYGNYAKAYFA